MKKFLFLTVSLLTVSCFAEWAFVRDNSVQFTLEKLPSTGRVIQTQVVVMGLQGADITTQVACGFYKIVSTNETPQGQMITATRYEIKSDCVEVKHDYAPIPPRNFEISKYKLLTELDKMQMFDQFDYWLDQLPKKYQRLWDAAVTLDYTNEMVQAALATLPTVMAVEPVTITNLLERAKADAR